MDQQGDLVLNVLGFVVLAAVYLAFIGHTDSAVSAMVAALALAAALCRKRL